NIRWALFNVMFKNIFRLPMNYNPVMPGLEVKYALEEAEKSGSKIVYLGYEIDDITISRLYHENRYTVLKTVLNFLTKMNRKYLNELTDFVNQVHQHGLRKYIESSCDSYFINWYILNDIGLYKCLVLYSLM